MTILLVFAFKRSHNIDCRCSTNLFFIQPKDHLIVTPPVSSLIRNALIRHPEQQCSQVPSGEAPCLELPDWKTQRQATAHTSPKLKARKAPRPVPNTAAQSRWQSSQRSRRTYDNAL